MSGSTPAPEENRDLWYQDVTNDKQKELPKLVDLRCERSKMSDSICFVDIESFENDAYHGLECRRHQNLKWGNPVNYKDDCFWGYCGNEAFDKINSDHVKVRENNHDLVLGYYFEPEGPGKFRGQTIFLFGVALVPYDEPSDTQLARFKETYDKHMG